MIYPATVHESERPVDRPDVPFAEPVNRVEIGTGYGPILYTFVDFGYHYVNRSFKERIKRLLAERLVMCLADDMGRSAHERGSTTVRRSALGRPELVVGANRGPSISFAWSEGTAWAAVGSGEYCVGIDVAAASEFEESYPIHRAFNRAELRLALNETRGNLPEAAALLWCLKEAALKALGCGFHLVDPLHVSVKPGRGQAQSNSFSIALVDEAVKRLALDGSPFLEITVTREQGFWLAVALFDPA